MRSLNQLLSFRTADVDTKFKSLKESSIPEPDSFQSSLLKNGGSYPTFLIMNLLNIYCFLVQYQFNGNTLWLHHGEKMVLQPLSRTIVEVTIPATFPEFRKGSYKDGLLRERQCGFLTKHSAPACRADFLRLFGNACSIIIFLDIRKAFEQVTHKALF